MSPTPSLPPKSFHLNCYMDPEPAALERLCQVIRIRGFRVLAMSAEQAEGAWSLSMTVAGIRPIEMLMSQIGKLTSVTQVNCSDSAPEAKQSA